MQKAYFMRLNIGDLHSSPAWRVMKPIQRGAYIELLTLCFGAGGKLPSDPDQLRLMSGMTAKEWGKYGALVLAQFEPHSDRDGTLTQSRVVKELTAMSEKADKARASASARWASGVDANALRTQSEGNAIQKTEDRRQKTDISPPTPQGGGAGEGDGRIEGGLGLTPEPSPPPKAGRKPKAPPEIPTVEMIAQFMLEKGWVAPHYWAAKIHGYYSERNWRQSNGKPLQFWKSAISVTWDKNRLTPEPSPNGRSTAQHNGRLGPPTRTAEGIRAAVVENLRRSGDL